MECIDFYVREDKTNILDYFKDIILKSQLLHLFAFMRVQEAFFGYKKIT